jgi:endonuclease YncB( thermonuclease family)
VARRKSSALTVVVVLVACALAWFLEHRADLVAESAGYEVYSGCRLVEGRGNDGDSFRVRFPDGAEHVLRLYFVDAPESGERTYRNGESNGTRLDDQARDLGGLTREGTIALGREAKERVHGILARGPFTVATRWQPVFDSGRYYAFVTVDGRFLHELLVEQGLARIYTRGAGLPDGTSRMVQERHLRALERQAKAARRGAWGER